MSSIRFSFKEKVDTKRQDDILESIASWEGVGVAARLVPHGKRAEIRRLCYIVLSAPNTLSAIVDKLEGYSEYIGYLEHNTAPIVIPQDARLNGPNNIRYKNNKPHKKNN